MRLDTGRQEWAKMWPLPLIAMLGVAGNATFTFAAGVFMEPMTAEFGWTRSQYYSGLTVQMIAAMVLVPVVGYLVDRFGCRRIALPGIVAYAAGLGLLGLAGGSLWQWWLLCLLAVPLMVFTTQPVWLSAVASRFQASRGLAMAVALSGMGVGNMVWPLAAALTIHALGWRTALRALPLGWGLIVLPLTWALFSDRGGLPAVHAAPLAKPRVFALLGSKRFVFLAAAGACFAGPMFALTAHLVPLLRSHGLGATTAAELAGLAGVFAVVGRIGVGYLLDRWATRQVAMIVFMTPILAFALLWRSDGSTPLAALAVALHGLAAGAEIDIIAYIASRQFDRRVYGTVYAVALSAFSLTASVGPLLAAVYFDLSGGYNLFLLTAAFLVMLATVLISLVPTQNAWES